MHPAPPEAFQNATSVDQLQLSSSPSTQHGLPNDDRRPSVGLLSASSPRELPPTLDDADNVSVSSSGTQRGRSANSRWISSRDGSSQESSPGSRIDEYERAHGQLRKRSDGMIFQIVPSARDKLSRVSIESFPNGGIPKLLVVDVTNISQRCSPIFSLTYPRKPFLL